MVVIEVPVICEAGSRTLQHLARGLGEVLERLEYGARKHPGETWEEDSYGAHLVHLMGHAHALEALRGDMRKHLASIACRALMALTVGRA